MNAPQRQYDIGKTQALYELLKAPDSQRNESWRNAVFSVVTDAPLALAKTQMVQGPDGFPYFVLLIPDEGMEFSPVTLLDVVEHVTDNGLGCIILDNENKLEEALYVFPFGDMFSLRHYGNFIGDKLDQEELAKHGGKGSESIQGGEVLLGAPSVQFLPEYARTAIGHYMRQVYGIESPSVALMVHVHSAPSRNLVFNIDQQLFKAKEDYINAIRRMRWFLPRAMGLVDNLALGDKLNSYYVSLLKHN